MSNRKKYVRLDKQEKADISYLYSRYNYTYRALAQIYKCGKSTICDIVNALSK
jgi:hypothetical protein